MEGKGLASTDDEPETPVLRPLVWLGNSKRNVQGFPRGVQKVIGDELQLIQFGPRMQRRSRASAAA
jgi:phage-related protein